MSNDERVERLNKRIGTTLPHSDTLTKNKDVAKPNIQKLKELAKDIRKNLEDYTNETATQTEPGYRFK